MLIYSKIEIYLILLIDSMDYFNITILLGVYQHKHPRCRCHIICWYLLQIVFNLFKYNTLLKLFIMEEKLEVLNEIMHKQFEVRKDLNDNLKEILNDLPSGISI